MTDYELTPERFGPDIKVSAIEDGVYLGMVTPYRGKWRATRSFKSRMFPTQDAAARYLVRLDRDMWPR